MSIKDMQFVTVEQVQRLREVAIMTEKQLEAAQLHIKELREALVDASESIADWGAYASDYFQDKYDLRGDVEKYHAVATKQPDTRALDKALLEARIDELLYLSERGFSANQDNQFISRKITAYQSELAELNKE